MIILWGLHSHYTYPFLTRRNFFYQSNNYETLSPINIIVGHFYGQNRTNSEIVEYYLSMNIFLRWVGGNIPLSPL